jgi:DNA primase
MTVNHTDLIKDKLSILDVVGSYVSLKQAGKTWKGKSPFTNEKTPSFFVHPDKGFFYCFSSGKGGDIFTFIQEIERVDFREALTILADRAGVDIDTKNLNADHGILYKLLDDATKWYEVNLRKNKDAVAYLTQRGLTKETLIEFRIGFAKDSWDDVYRFLKSKKYSDKHIQQAGLTVKKEKGGYYDRFRSRIMFTLFDTQGRIVGFSGRIFSDNKDEKGAKYVNSPEGPLFDKSKMLYGYHRAKRDFSSKDSAIIVEGQFDVLMAQQSGSVNTVAVSGTGLTDDQLKMIKRFTQTLYLAFDSDAAGLKAAKRSVLKAYEHNMKVKVISLPIGQDPADIISNSKEQWEVCVADAQDYVDYHLSMFQRQYPDASFEDKHALVTKELFEILYLMESSVTQEKVLQRLALFLGVSLSSIQKDFDSYTPVETVVKYEEKLPEPSPQPKKSLKEDILGTLVYLKAQYPEDIQADLSDIEERFFETYQVTVADILAESGKQKKEMWIFKYETQHSDDSYDKVLQLLNLNLNQELISVLKHMSDLLLNEIRSAEQKKDEKRLSQLQSEHLTLRKRIDHLTNV